MLILKRWKYSVGQIVMVAGENGREVKGRIERQYLRRVSLFRYIPQYGIRYCPHGSERYRIGVIDETELHETPSPRQTHGGKQK